MRGVARLLLACFFTSGLTGLIYEILWTRMIVQIIGTAPFAITIVLTTFMGGLGLGSYVASRTIDRVKNPMVLVRIYGVLEVVIGAYCLVLPGILSVFRPVYALIYNRLFDHFMPYSLLTFAGCTVILLVPVVCMGATLPILCRFYVTSLVHLGTRTGRLYGLNTLGAAVGALLCGFWLIPLLGVSGTLFLAVSANGLIGLACIGASIRVRLPATEDAPAHTSHRDITPAYGPALVAAALVVFAASGFCSMAYEVIWTKLLALVVGPTTYSFTLVLVTFITCLAMGSLFFGWLGDRTERPMRLLLGTQFGAAVSALLVSQILGDSQLFFSKLLYHSKDHFVWMNVAKATSIFLFMLAPAFCLGATFPLVGKIYTNSVSSLGRSLGMAYTLNTVGAVLGSFSAGFILVPWIGKEKSLSLIVAVQILTSLVVTGMTLARERGRAWKLSVVALSGIAALVLCGAVPRWDRHLLSKGIYHRFSDSGVDLGALGWGEALLKGPEILGRTKQGELVYYGDGIGGFTTVTKYPYPFGEPTYTMANSGKADASSRGDMETQTLLAHLPMLLHAQPKTVMVLGLASGITAGEVLYYPMETLDVLEISQQVAEASRFFLPWNNHVLSDPRTHLIVQDARAHLQLTDRIYDVVISEPSNPWMAGLATLFTQDFFQLVKDRLGPDGIFVQWFHTYRMDWPTFSLVGRTFVSVFPNSTLWVTNPSGYGGDFLLVGFKGPAGLDLNHAAQGLPFAQKSKNVTLPDARLLVRLLVSEDLGNLFGEGRINTDNRPWLEFAAPRLLYHSMTGVDPAIEEKLIRKRSLRPETQDLMKRLLTDVDAQIDFATYAFSVNSPFPNMVDLTRATPAQRERFLGMADQYMAHNPIDDPPFADEALRRQISQHRTLAQINAFKSKVDSAPDKAGAYLQLATLYSDAGLNEEAVRWYKKALEIQPDSIVAMNNLAWLLAVHRQAPYFDPQEALRLATRVKEMTPQPDSDVLDTLAAAYAASGRFAEAQAAASQAMQLAAASNHTALAEQIQKRLHLYKAGQAYTEQ